MKILVEMIELASYHYSIVRNLTYLPVGVQRSLLNWLNLGIHRTICQYDTMSTLEGVVQILVELVELALDHSMT